MQLTPIIFWILAVLTGVSAIAVVVTQNIVRAAAFLLFTLAGVSGIFFLLCADFVGATQLLVYVGGTLVLVVFGVMLTAQGPFINLRISAVEWALAAGVGLVLFGVLTVAVWPATPPQYREADTNRQLAPSIVLGESLLGFEQATPWWRKRTAYDPPQETNERIRPENITISATGAPANADNPRPRTRMAYLLPFEIVSVHLLVVLIGAAYLARAKRRRAAPEQLP
jgi:NADH-quinone oxidoreductase subunit J